MSWVATAIGGGALVGALGNVFGATKAASAQEKATQLAQQTQMNMYNTTRGDLSAYRNAGADATAQLQAQMPFLTSPIVMDEATLQNTPGYQFNLKQGLKATQNAAAARGLGVSGAALKGAATFATGLADNTYQNQFANENTNRTNAYNRLMGLITTGENAAAQTGSAGTNAANAIGNAQVGAGNAEAAKYNAFGGALSGATNNLSGYAMYKSLYNGGGGNPMGYAPNPNGGDISPMFG